MAGKDDKTEIPTSIRRRKAREEGQVAQSQQVSSTASLTFAVVALAWVLSYRGGFRGLMSRVLETGILDDLSEAAMLAVVNETGAYFLLLVAPILASAWVGALAGNLVQGLPNIATKAFKPKWEKLNPAKGLQKLRTKANPAEWARFFVLLSALIVALWQTLGGNWDELMRSPGIPIEAGNALLREILIRVLTYVVLTLIVLAVIDFFYQKYQFEKNLKQSKSEVKEDNKQMDGNPQVKGKIRSIQREQAKKRMMAAVQDADVIITNPTHFAVALEYKPDLMGAPRVIAKGQDYLAERIKEAGREYDIPQVENVPLARSLYWSVEVGQEIPLNLYKAVAEVLAYVFKVRKRMKRVG